MNKYLIFFYIFCVSCKKEAAQPLPIAQFFAEQKECSNDSCLFYFYDNSENAVELEWDFDNGAHSTQNIDSTFFVSGNTYTVQLKASNLDGISDTKEKKIEF